MFFSFCRATPTNKLRQEYTYTSKPPIVSNVPEGAPSPASHPAFLLLHPSATSRLLLHKSIHDKVVAKILERAASVSVGDPLRGDEEEGGAKAVACMGPLVSGPQRDKVLGFISRVRRGRQNRERARGERHLGGRVVGGGSRRGRGQSREVVDCVGLVLAAWRPRSAAPRIRFSCWRMPCVAGGKPGRRHVRPSWLFYAVPLSLPVAPPGRHDSGGLSVIFFHQTFRSSFCLRW